MTDISERAEELLSNADDWIEAQVEHGTGVTTFFGIDESYETSRRKALRDIFKAGQASLIVFPHENEPPPYVVSIYACRHRDTDAEPADMVFVGTAWRIDRMPNLPELITAFRAWRPTSEVDCTASWSDRT